MVAVVERIKVIDVDTHIAEPEDLWTSRVAGKWGNLVPHVERDAETGDDRWMFGETKGMPVAAPAMAGWREFPPSHPPTLADADPGSWDPRIRLQRMDQYGIHAQVIYPNVGGFGSGGFLRLGEPELMLDCVRAYNDFLADWCSLDPKRLVPIMAIPFWDLDATVKEINRAAGIGHKGVIFGGEPQTFDQPVLGDPHWEPLWHAAEDAGLTINFHIASGDFSAIAVPSHPDSGKRANFARQSVMYFLDNSRAVTEVITSGICHRHPKLNFVSVESGIGWVPFTLEALDWQWYNAGAHQEHPERLKPSEYFKRQVYACFWFERGSARAAIDQLGPDNFLYETDFPHPTSMSPGPASFAQNPRDFIEDTLAGLPDESLRKILHDNAARLYHLE